jgi:outer membrane protein OmpA-like peptidoglycan-associated protein
VTRLLATVACSALLCACVHPPTVVHTLDEADAVIGEAQGVYAKVCAPEELANAEAHSAFTNIEFDEGDLHRAREHADASLHWAQLALEKAIPCGTADRDEDTIIDLVDECPDEPEDFDGTEDEDGCRDISPTGDEDGDGIINIDDGCVWEPEDFDGHNDHDGCPETSADSDGDGLIDAVDQCPEEAEDIDAFNDDDGCPELDNDLDGVTDLRDACMNIPEDLDGWDDEDGCPEADNDGDGLADIDDNCPNEPGPRERMGCPVLDRDGDGIADGNDACPDEPETVNAYLDQDGCPDTPPSRVHVTRQQIELDDHILFETGRATLLPKSLPILDDVQKVLVDVPVMTLRIEGHTDSQGSEELNMRLSQERADSVRTYLLSRGVEPGRLEAIGYGETRPIDTNRTASGRQNNRRVEFHITQQ